MASKVCSRCEKQLTEKIASLGYEMIDLQYAKNYDGYNLNVTIDAPQGILIEDCEKVHRAVDALLDEINPTDDEPYVLNISSPGIDRPLTLMRDYERNLNKEIEVKLFAPLNKKKSYIGVLTGYDKDNFEITSNNEKLVFEKSKVAQVIPVIKF